MFTLDTETLASLNGILKNKLTAINQCFLHARMLKHMKAFALADQEYKASLDSMKHTDMLVEHILSSGGLPNLQDMGALAIGGDTAEMLSNDLALLEATLSLINDSIAQSEEKGHLPTVALLARIKDNTRERIAQIRAQLVQERAGAAV